MRIKNIMVIMCMIVILASQVMAEEPSTTLGTYMKGECVELIQTCSSCSAVEILAISYPNSSIADSSITMEKTGSRYNYTFCDTEALGVYIVSGEGDVDGTDTIFVYDFEVTYSGQKVSLSNSMIIFALLGLAAIFLTISFFFNKDYWMLQSFFQFLAVLAGLIAINSGRIIASESNALGIMGDMGLLLMIVVLLIFFLWIFVRAFKEIIAIFKKKGDLRWEY